MLSYRKKWIIANPKNTVAAVGRMPGQEVATVRQQSTGSLVLSAPSCDAVRHKCIEMHSGLALKFTEAGSWIKLAVKYAETMLSMSSPVKNNLASQFW